MSPPTTTRGPSSFCTAAWRRRASRWSADLANAIRNVFLNPNIGPFIGKQLIQKLVTGHPSPQYVARVAAAFNNNGQNVRGDMKAVVRAILTDPEARGAVKLDPGYGKLREPVLYLTGAARAVNTKSDGVVFGPAGSCSARTCSIPSRYSTTTRRTTSCRRPRCSAPSSRCRTRPPTSIASMSPLLLAFGTIQPLVTYPGATGTQPDWTALQAVAGNTSALIDKLDALLLHGTMPAAMRSGLATAIDALPASDPLNRAKTGYYLVVTSSEYQVER